MNNITYVLIDDDLLIRKSWEFASKKATVSFQSFENVDSFLEEDFDPEKTTIYIDQELKNGLLGANEAQKLFDKGFHSIYLATGHAPDSIDKPSYILEITGKKPPF